VHIRTICEKFTTAVSEAVDKEEEGGGKTEALAKVLSEMEDSKAVKKYPKV
jgi:hypothetical protein